jgi:hypothetical protein
LIDPTFFVFICGTLLPCCQNFFYCFVSGEGDFDLGVLEYLRDDSCFFTYIFKFSPFFVTLLSSTAKWAKFTYVGKETSHYEDIQEHQGQSFLHH